MGDGRRHATAGRREGEPPGDRARPGGRDSRSAVTGPFYLTGLLRCCGVPMWSVTRAGSPRSRCAACGWGVDAVAREVEVWELAHTSQPRLGHPHTPYGERGGLLAVALRAVEVTHGRSGHQFALVR